MWGVQDNMCSVARPNPGPAYFPVHLAPYESYKATTVYIGNNSRCNTYSHFDVAIVHKSCKISQHDALSPP